MSHDTKVALVTGGNRGIGYELVKQLALKGFEAILATRDPQKGQEAIQKLKELNLDISFVVLDVDNQESIRQAAITVNERYGRLDVLINNAGVYLDQNEKLLNMEPSILERTLTTNFFGAYHVIRSFIPLMEKQGYGRIINVSSDVKAFISGTFHGLDSRQMQAYLDEFCYRFNRRKFKGELFNRLIQSCVTTSTITYSELTE